MKNNKFKDKDFYETNNNIDKIFRCLKLKYKINFSKDRCISYSNQVLCRDIGLISNGKGESKIDAICSGKSEMLERIMNYSFIRINSDVLLKQHIIPKKYKKRTFDELKSDIYTFLILEDKFETKLYNLIIETCKEYYKNSYISVPFFNTKTKQLIYIPTFILDFFLGTNGMAAGNTYYEAYVQAYSEIRERLFIKNILSKKCNLVCYSLDYINNNLLINLKNFFKGDIYIFKWNDNNYIKSLCILLIYKGKYRIKFGSHFDFDTALERCITELLQGSTLYDEYSWFSIKDFNTIKNNFLGFFTGNISRVNNNFFLNIKNSKFFKRTENLNLYNNEEVVKLIESKENNVYIFSNYLMDIKSLQIYIPKLSLIDNLNTETINNILIKIKASNLIYSNKENAIKYFLDKFDNNTTLDLIGFDKCTIAKQYLNNISIRKLKSIWINDSINHKNFHLNYCVICPAKNTKHCLDYNKIQLVKEMDKYSE
ncbi:YcaO-like family protein [Anaerococcus sp. AGMB00486]|uniref:YcaO-like family protein n=1 Tax=Anaerococcus faecalis TaxID=2742993 RepID=A0ABX2NBU9_9FIRM|nr:YcaO-like family protein [Anaerococcus faecalis]NVF12158.1 YcaO-like family protein [Anaerococcus faecalis]